MRTCNMVTAILWVTAALLSWAAGERAQYRPPADLGLSPVPLPSKTKESRACTYQGKTGTCYGTVECLALAGTFGNFCRGLSGLCCLFHRSCGMRTSQKSAYFQNENYPQSARVEKNCEMRVVKRSDEFCALRVIMKEADFPKPSRAGFCNDASYVVTGTRSSAIAPKCGDLTGQTYTYDMRYTDELQLSINTTTMRNGLQWNMEIHQVPCSEYNNQLAGGDGVEAGSGSEGGTVPIEPDGSTGTQGPIGPDGSTGTQGPIGPDGSTGTQGPTAPLKPPPVKPPAPPAPPPTKPTSPPPSNIKCGERGPPFTTSRSRDYARIWEPTGRRNYPRPGETFQRPSSTYRGGRPNRRTSNRRRPNRKSSSNRSTINKRQETDSKQTSAVQQETTVVPKPRFTGVIKSTEWGVPDLTDTLFHEYMGQRFRPPTRITFGRLAGIREIPWQVAMVVDGKFHCGGVLIGEQWILTAAHCVVRYKDTPHKLELTLGDWDLKTDKDGKSLNVTAQRVTVHPSYSRATLQNDVAVIRLASTVTYTERIKPACLPTTDIELAGKECTISGWGRNEAKLLQEQLQVLEAKVVSNVLCDERWNTQGAPKGFIVDSMKCMDATSGDSCNGDSGGPSVLEHPPGSGRYVLVGIVSFGSGSCVDPQLPGVYTRVSYFRQWISDNMV
ncbi:serine proteinase stubble-like isoform X2 [Portunus trituberculatus]|uniref:serine proteinase stubble-like isoform X2 n=1 Tax=Portunus trituberculatus TaxID=210409 RepID=UPI001E1CD826|nr:serine proteinase stubble-like isoform X2 [Portunus trituberculatus]